MRVSLFFFHSPVLWCPKIFNIGREGVKGWGVELRAQGKAERFSRYYLNFSPQPISMAQNLMVLRGAHSGMRQKDVYSL